MVREMDQFKRDILTSELQFAVNFLQMTHLDKTDVMSPASLSLALTLIQQGTKGETRKKINKVVLNGVCDKHFLVNQKFIQQTLQRAGNGVVLEITNKLFVADRIEVKDEYKNNLEENFDAEVEMLDFNNTSECVKIISEFIKTATKGLIEPQVDENTINDSCACFISVLYSRALWDWPFKVEDTKLDEFTKADRTTRDILFMCDKAHFPYYEDRGVQVFGKKYKDHAFQFVWILPKDPTAKGFEEFRSALTGKNIQKYLSELKLKEINVKVPKMVMENQFDPLKILKHFDLDELTSTSANFSGITDNEFKLSSGSHSTLLEVDEIGTVDVAATSCWTSHFAGPPPPNFYATRQFVFLIHQNQHPIRPV